MKMKRSIFPASLTEIERGQVNNDRWKSVCERCGGKMQVGEQAWWWRLLEIKVYPGVHDRCVTDDEIAMLILSQTEILTWDDYARGGQPHGKSLQPHGVARKGG